MKQSATRENLKRPRLAVVATSWRASSHAEAIAGKLIQGYGEGDRRGRPRCRVVAIHVLQRSSDDIASGVSAEHGIPIYHSVASALCQGGDELSVDGVVIIGEHGEYPRNAKGQKMYPRRELFDQVVGVFRQSARVVPVFIDKHFSWNWAWAKHMWRVSQQLGIPIMAGSCVPYATFAPSVDLPVGHPIEQVVSFGYGPAEILEDYGFHALELGQAVIEHRRGGEVGVSSVRCLSGEDVLGVVDAAPGSAAGEVLDRSVSAIQSSRGTLADHVPDLFAFEAVYRDGARLTALMLGAYCSEFGFAYSTGAGEVMATSATLDESPRMSHFNPLVRGIEEMFLTGHPVVDAARTYLVTGVLAYGLESRARGGQTVPTPDLDVRYQPRQLAPRHREVSR